MQASVQSCDSSKGKTAFTRLTGKEQQITLKWKNPENITGYQIQNGLKKNFKGAEKAKIPETKTLTTIITKLEVKTTCYVRIRTDRPGIPSI